MINRVTNSTATMSGPESQEKQKPLGEQINDVKAKLKNSDLSDTERDALFEEFGKLSTQQEKANALVDQPLEKPIDEYTDADIAKKGKEEIKKDAQKDLTEQAMKEVGGREYTGSKEDLIASLTRQLNKEKANSAKNVEKSREMLFAKERMSPKEIFNRWRLGNVYDIMKKLRAKGAESTIKYCMAMQKSRVGRKLISPLKRAGLETGIAGIFDVNMTDFSAQMANFKERFKLTTEEQQSDKEGTLTKVQIMKKEIYNMAAEAADEYLEKLNEKNKINKL